MKPNSSMGYRSESQELGQPNHSQGPAEHLGETPPGINISERIQPLQRPMLVYPLHMEGTYGQGSQPSQQEYLRRLAEGSMQPTNYLTQRPLGFNAHPDPRAGSSPYDALPHYQYSHQHQRFFPMEQQHLQTQLQHKYSMIAPCVINRTPEFQHPEMDLSGQDHSTLQAQNYTQPFQNPTQIDNTEGKYDNGTPGTGICNVKTVNEFPTANHQVAAISKEEKSSRGPGANLEPPFLSVNLDFCLPEEIIHFRLHYVGVQIKVLEIECEFLNNKKEDDFLLIIKKCPNVEDLKLKFKNFRAMSYKKELMSFTSNRFKCSQLKNLSSFEFTSYVASPHRRTHASLKNGITFYENVFKEFVKASGNLKHLVLRSLHLDCYLEAVTANLDVGHKFNQLHTLRVVADVSCDNLEFVNNALLNFLPIVSSSLEILHLCHFKSIDLSRYPFMAKLKTIINESDIQYSNLNVSTTSLPQLRNLIFCHDKIAELNVEFGWPLNEDVFKSDQVGNGISEDLIPAPLNIVFYAKWRVIDPIAYKELCLDQFLEKISQARVNALFIDFSSYGYRVQEMESMIQMISRYVRGTPALKHCLIRIANTLGSPPKVIDMLQRHY